MSTVEYKAKKNLGESDVAGHRSERVGPQAPPRARARDLGSRGLTSLVPG